MVGFRRWRRAGHGPFSPYPLFLRSLSLSLPVVAVVSAGYAFVLDDFGVHWLLAGVAVGVVDQYLVTVENSFSRPGFGFTVGGMDNADIFLGYISELVFWCIESEFVTELVCAAEDVVRGDCPSIGGLSVFVRLFA